MFQREYRFIYRIHLNPKNASKSYSMAPGSIVGFA